MDIKTNTFYKIKFSFRNKISKIKTHSVKRTDNSILFAYVRNGNIGKFDYVISERVLDNIESLEEITKEVAIETKKKEKKVILKNEPFEAGEIVEFSFKGEVKQTVYVLKKEKDKVISAGFHKRKRSEMYYFKYQNEDIIGTRVVKGKEKERYENRIQGFKKAIYRDQSRIETELVLKYFEVTYFYNKKDKTITIENKKTNKTLTLHVNIYNKKQFLEELKEKLQELNDVLGEVRLETFYHSVIQNHTNKLRNIVGLGMA